MSDHDYEQRKANTASDPGKHVDAPTVGGATRVAEQQAQAARSTARGPMPAPTNSPAAWTYGSAPAAAALAPATAQHGEALQYFSRHHSLFMAALQSQLIKVTAWPTLSGLTIPGGPGFAYGLLAGVSAASAAELPGLVYPAADSWEVINRYRLPTKEDAAAEVLGRLSMTWQPEAGGALALAVETSVRASLPRMSARYQAKATEGAPPTIAELLPSAPIDRVVAEALCAVMNVANANGASKGPLRSTVKHATAPAATAYDVQRDGPRGLTYEWLGATKPALWNWLKVTNVTQPSAEEIAITLWGHASKSTHYPGAEFAAMVTVMGQYATVEKSWARSLPDVPGKPNLTAPGTSAPMFDAEAPAAATDLMTSGLADEAALAEAGAPGQARVNRAAILDQLQSTLRIFEDMAQRVGPWGLQRDVLAVQQVIRTKATWVAGATLKELTPWANVFAGQRQIASEAAAGIVQVLDGCAAVGLAAGSDRRKDPVLVVLRAYAEAAEASMLVTTGGAKLTYAKQQHTMLPFSRLALADATMIRGAKELSNDGGGAGGHASDPTSLAGQRAHAHDAAMTAQAQGLGAGAKATAIDAAMLEIEAVNCRTQLASVAHGLFSLETAFAAADKGFIAKLANGLSGDLRMAVLPATLAKARQRMLSIDVVLARLQPADTREMRLAALDEARRKFGAAVVQYGLDGRLQQVAEATLQDAALHAAVMQMVVIVAASIVTGGIGTYVGELAAGIVSGSRVAATASEAIALGRTARIVGGVIGTGVEAVLGAGAQTVTQGGSTWDAFVENLAINAVFLTALQPLQQLARRWAQVDAEALALWSQQGRKWAARAATGAVASVEMVQSIATAHVAGALMKRARGQAVDDLTLQNLTVQGAAAALGHMVHTRLSTSMAILREAGFARGDLMMRMRRVDRTAVQAWKASDAGAAAKGLTVFAEHTQLVQDELAFWKSQDVTAAKVKLLPHQIEARERGLEQHAAAVKDKAYGFLTLQMHRITQEVAGTAMWAGEAKDIAAALAYARKLGVTVEMLDDAAAPPPADSAAPIPHERILRVVLNGERLDIRERVSGQAPATPAPAATSPRRNHVNAPKQSTGEVAEIVYQDDGYTPVVPAGASPAEMHAHIEAAKKLAGKHSWARQMLDKLLRSKPAPAGSNAARAEMELYKNSVRLARMETREAAAHKGRPLPPDELADLQAAIAVTKSAMQHWDTVAMRRDTTPDAAPIEAMDSPAPGLLPAPPEGHIYVMVSAAAPGIDAPAGKYPAARWNIRRKAGQLVPSLELDLAGPIGATKPRQSGNEPEPKFAAGTTKAQALAMMIDSEEGGSFGPFMKMLEAQGIASHDEVLATMGDPSTVTVRSIRHGLKQEYLPAVEKLVLHGNAKGTGEPLSQAASVQKLREVLKGLNSSDMGAIGERWAAHWGEQWHGQASEPHQMMTPQDFPELSTTRFPDHQYGELLSDTKTGETLATRERVQLDEMVAVTEQKKGRSLNGHKLKRVEVTFTHPDAAKNNREWIAKRLEANEHLTIRCFDKEGNMHVFTSANQTAFSSYARGVQ